MKTWNVYSTRSEVYDSDTDRWRTLDESMGRGESPLEHFALDPQRGEELYAKNLGDLAYKVISTLQQEELEKSVVGDMRGLRISYTPPFDIEYREQLSKEGIPERVSRLVAVEYGPDDRRKFEGCLDHYREEARKQMEPTDLVSTPA